ncbi:STAS/SEC14 domain-containing protein [Sediminibacterium ginsengisoli]|uniref:SpoIIAA-like n=1 Tax=Sediminibacterium ginsengisoli TaxID=413434 RepID=A0A1T4P5H8_9BACT|nr:STAS/SEC14 domain-containing protein [Sediminibacterium ginsengisoli]SJZ86699.1 SpoIIAA-like [Sediminibacterium ginsengisoli]
MITRITDVPDNMVAFHAVGKVDAADFETVVVPAVSELVKRTGELNYLMLIDTELSDFTAGAWFQDMLLGITKFTKWKRVAILTDSAAVNKFTDIFSIVAPGEFKGFRKEEFDLAVEWVSAA